MEKIYKGEIQRLLPIFQAMADGRIIQFSSDDDYWIDIDGEEEGLLLDTLIGNPKYYRIKPEVTYRPFKDVKECWNEMLKHQPFGWIKGKEGDHYSLITSIIADEEEVYINGISGFVLDEIMEHYTFADGTPFGIKEQK